jgi:AcrR family transcriptional regulator
MPRVNPQSRTSRRERAAATRSRMIRAAYDLFCERGYRATTMEAIAQRAGVAVQTLYFTFHTKDELLQAVHEWTVLTDDPTPPPLQEWYLAAMAESDARRALAMLIEGLATIESRVAPMIPVFHAVSADPAGEIYRRAQVLRRQGMEDCIDALSKKARLRPGLTRRRAADLLYILAGPEAYRSFVLEAGWTERQWVTWTTQTLTGDLFGLPL